MENDAARRFNEIMGWIQVCGIQMSMERADHLFRGLRTEAAAVKILTKMELQKEGRKERCLAIR